MIRDRTIAEATIMIQVSLVEFQRSQWNTTRTMMLVQMHRVLTPDQDTKFAALQERLNRDRGRGPGRLKPH
jgi:Spy/CpxP family protein refolding chaperone